MGSGGAGCKGGVRAGGKEGVVGSGGQVVRRGWRGRWGWGGAGSREGKWGEAGWCVSRRHLQIGGAKLFLEVHGLGRCCHHLL